MKYSHVIHSLLQPMPNQKHEHFYFLVQYFIQKKRFIFLILHAMNRRNMYEWTFQREIEKNYENWICDWMSSKRKLFQFAWKKTKKIEQNIEKQTSDLKKKKKRNGTEWILFLLTVWYSSFNECPKLSPIIILVVVFSPSFCVSALGFK